MRLRVRILNSLGFVLAAFCMFLPFVDARIPAGLGAGGYWWTGSDMVRGGQLAQEMQLFSPTGSGTAQIESTNVVDLYGVDYFDAIHYLPTQPTAGLAIIFMLIGAVAALMRPSRGTVTGAASAAIAAVAALAMAQIEAVRHVQRAWPAVIGDGAMTNMFKPAIGYGYGFWVTIGLLSALILANVALAVGGSAFQNRDHTLATGRAD